MTDDSPLPTTRPKQEAARNRRSLDFAVLTGLFAAVLFVLMLMGAIAPLQAVTASLVVACAAIAYFAGSASTLSEPADPPAALQAEAAAAQHQRLLEALPWPAFEIDSASRIVAYNSAARAELSLQGRVAPRASTVIRSPVLLSAIEKAARDGADPTVIAEIDAGNDQVWRAHVSRLAEGARTLVLLEDMTLIRRTSRARSDFIANASHELRTPLTTITGLIETLRGPAREDRAAWDRFLDIMARESARMNRLIADLLSLSRIEASERDTPSAREDFNSIVRECVQLLQTEAEQRRVTLAIAESSAPLPVVAHRDEMIQVIVNLISNALKYSPAGAGVSVHFGRSGDFADARARAAQRWSDASRMTLLAPPFRASAGDAAVWLRVEDHGPGIEAEHLPRLGERFYRADQSRGGAITGTGLGLAIVKHIMAHHRGGLAVETVEGQGSAFGVWFAAPAESQDVARPSGP